MDSITTFSLVERKKYDASKAHGVTEGIWWVGFFEGDFNGAFNPYLLIDGSEAVLINPGSMADTHCNQVVKKIESIIAPACIGHIVVLHNDPDRCAALPHFEMMADRNVRIYAPRPVMQSVKYCGCKNPVIGLDDGDSIIMKSGRIIDYYDTPNLAFSGSGMLHDKKTGTVFIGNLFHCGCDQEELFAPGNSWDSLQAASSGENCSKKAFLEALNKIERLSPERICFHRGPIIEENVDKFIEAARKLEECE